MSNLVFTPCTGAVVISRESYCSSSNFLQVRIGSEEFNTKFILQSVTLELSGNYQFLHTVNDFVYFYTFGDRVGMLTLTGIGFLQMCQGSSEKEGAPIFEIYKYYNENKASAKQGKALNVVLTPPGGGTTVKLHGFLTGVKTELTQSDTGPIGYWTLRMEVLPQKQ